MSVLSNAQDFIPMKICGADSITQINKLKGKWKYVGHYYCRVYGGVLDKKPKFLIGDTSYIFTDTFVNYRCSVDEVKNDAFLHEMYEFKSVDTNVVAYRFIIRTKTLPISVKAVSRNPYYELSNEFILYKDTIYYDLDGIIYKFKKYGKSGKVFNK